MKPPTDDLPFIEAPPSLMLPANEYCPGPGALIKSLASTLVDVPKICPFSMSMLPRVLYMPGPGAVLLTPTPLPLLSVPKPKFFLTFLDDPDMPVLYAPGPTLAVVYGFIARDEPYFPPKAPPAVFGRIPLTAYYPGPGVFFYGPKNPPFSFFAPIVLPFVPKELPTPY